MEFAPPPVETKNPIDMVKIIINVLVGIVFGILLFLILSKFGVITVLKGWFALVIFMCLSIAFALVLYPLLGYSLISVFSWKISFAEIIAVPLAFIITYVKLFRRNMLIHNLSELFVYPGFSIVLLPILNVTTAAALMLAISIYDIVAVWRSNYMFNLANFQVKHLKVFAGFFVPYIRKEDRAKVKLAKAMVKTNKKLANSKLKKINIKVAALGGGDVAIPMLFLGAIFLAWGLWAYFIVLAFTILALFYLLIKSEKDKAYPAMPFISVGALIGIFVVLFIKVIFGV
jgi:presenilin-like A22 family membrane protease